MAKKKKPDIPVPGPEEWQTMFSGMGLAKNGKKLFKPDKDGWVKIFGDIDLVSAAAEGKTDAKNSRKNYQARFMSPMSGVMQVQQNGIKSGQRYEVVYHASTNSEAGFLATTVTFLSDKGAPLGIPSSGGVKLNTLATDSYTPVSVVTGPAPEGAAKAQLTFVVFGSELDKVVDINKVSFKVVS